MANPESSKDNSSTSIDPRISQKWQAAFWLALILLCAVLALIAILLIRSGFFRFTASITDTQYKALWTFLASALGAAVTLIGLTLTQSHNARTLALQADAESRHSIAQQEAEDRQKLETAVRGLELLSADEGKYAVSAQVAGTLAALVHLDHPVIAMRSLRAAWFDGKVDVATAVWLINEVLERGTPASQVEGSHLLHEHATELCDKRDDHEGEFEWPELLYREWPDGTPRVCRFEILFAIVDVLTSRSKAWWEYSSGWAIVLLYEAMKKDSDPVLRDSACHLINPIINAYPTKDVNLPWQDDVKKLTEVEEYVRNYEHCGRITARTTKLVKELEDWRNRKA